MYWFVFQYGTTLKLCPVVAAILQVGWQKLFLEIMQCCISNVEYDCLADLLGNDIILLFIILLGK